MVSLYEQGSGRLVLDAEGSTTGAYNSWRDVGEMLRVPLQCRVDGVLWRSREVLRMDAARARDTHLRPRGHGTQLSVHDVLNHV